MGRKSDPSKQGLGNGGIAPPKKYQFGQPNGNPRHNGAWKKEDTIRYKWERLLQLSVEELEAVKNDSTEVEFLRATANCILLMRSASDLEDAVKSFILMEKYANQVYGQPKQQVETIDITPPPLSPRKQKK